METVKWTEKIKKKCEINRMSFEGVHTTQADIQSLCVFVPCLSRNLFLPYIVPLLFINKHWHICMVSPKQNMVYNQLQRERATRRETDRNEKSQIEWWARWQHPARWGLKNNNQRLRHRNCFAFTYFLWAMCLNRAHVPIGECERRNSEKLCQPNEQRIFSTGDKIQDRAKQNKTEKTRITYLIRISFSIHFGRNVVSWTPSHTEKRVRPFQSVLC